MRSPNWYTCSSLICIDQLIYKLQGKNVYWSNNGTLVEEHKNGVKCQVQTHFPDWMFILAANIQGRWPWTRHLLSL